MSDTWPSKDPDEPLDGPFWAAARSGQLVMQACGSCGYIRWPPAPLCPECLTFGGEWRCVEPHGSLWSFATYRRALQASMANEVPYTVGLIELDDGPRMYGRLRNEPGTFDCGMRVQAVFTELADGKVFVEWEVAAA